MTLTSDSRFNVETIFYLKMHLLFNFIKKISVGEDPISSFSIQTLEVQAGESLFSWNEKVQIRSVLLYMER
jgi:hypothetical protein